MQYFGSSIFIGAYCKLLTLSIIKLSEKWNICIESHTAKHETALICSASTVFYKQMVCSFIFYTFIISKFYWIFKLFSNKFRFWKPEFQCLKKSANDTVWGHVRSIKLIQRIWMFLIGWNIGLLMAPPKLEGQTIGPTFIFTQN